MDRRAFRLAYAAWLFGIFAYFIPAATWNPVSRFNLTRAIVERGSFQIDPYADSTGDRAKVGDHWYTDKAPGVSFLAVPAYAALHTLHTLRGLTPGYHAEGTEQRPAARFVPNLAFRQGLYVSTLSTAALAGTAIALLLFELLRRRTTTRTAFLASSMVTLGSPLLPYATTFYGHVPAAAFLLGAIVCLDPRGQEPDRAAPPRRRVLAAGACLAFSVACEYLTALPAALLALWFLTNVPRELRARTLSGLVLGGAGPVALVAAYHTSAFGAPWRTGYSFLQDPRFVSGHARGLLGVSLPSWEALYGLSFGRLRGLFYLWPMLSVATMFTGLVAWRRRDPAVAAGLAAFALIFSLNAGYYMWWGGAAVAPRHLLPGIPILAAGLALALRSSRRWLVAGVVGLFLISAAISVGLTGVGIEAPERGDLLRDYLFDKLAAGKVKTFAGASNLGQKLGLPATPVSVLPVFAWIALGYAYLLWRLNQASARARFEP